VPDLTGYAAAGINGGRLRYSLGWENLSSAERNLRVRLSETGTVMHVHHVTT